MIPGLKEWLLLSWIDLFWAYLPHIVPHKASKERRGKIKKWIINEEGLILKHRNGGVRNKQREKKLRSMQGKKQSLPLKGFLLWNAEAASSISMCFYSSQICVLPSLFFLVIRPLKKSLSTMHMLWKSHVPIFRLTLFHSGSSSIWKPDYKWKVVSTVNMSGETLVPNKIYPGFMLGKSSLYTGTNPIFPTFQLSAG